MHDINANFAFYQIAEASCTMWHTNDPEDENEENKCEVEEEGLRMWEPNDEEFPRLSFIVDSRYKVPVNRPVAKIKVSIVFYILSDKADKICKANPLQK